MQFRPQVVAPRVREPRGQGDQGEAGHQHRQRRAEGRRNPPTGVIITFSPDHFRHLDCEIDEIVSLSNGSGLSFGSLVTNDALFFVVPGLNPSKSQVITQGHAVVGEQQEEQDVRS